MSFWEEKYKHSYVLNEDTMNPIQLTFWAFDISSQKPTLLSPRSGQWLTALPHSRGRANQLETNSHQRTANMTRLCQEGASLDFAYMQTLAPPAAHWFHERQLYWIILKNNKSINKILVWNWEAGSQGRSVPGDLSPASCSSVQTSGFKRRFFGSEHF